MFRGLLYGKSRLSVTSRKFTTFLSASICNLQTVLSACRGDALVTPRPSSLYKPKLHALPNLSLFCGRGKCRRVRMIRRHRNCPWSHQRGLMTFSCSMAHRSCREENFLPEGYTVCSLSVCYNEIFVGNFIWGVPYMPCGTKLSSN